MKDNNRFAVTVGLAIIFLSVFFTNSIRAVPPQLESMLGSGSSGIQLAQYVEPPSPVKPPGTTGGLGGHLEPPSPQKPPATTGVSGSRPEKPHPTTGGIGYRRPARIQDHIKVGRYFRERGQYSDAISVLEKARSTDPENKKVQRELEITRKACNAEKRLGRKGLRC